jgi:DNA-binding CsgD family transcriptional regulator
MRWRTDETKWIISHDAQQRGNSVSRAESLRQTLENPLTRRETQMLIALGEGKTTRETRSQLGVTEATVNTYLERLKKKLELTNIK